MGIAVFSGTTRSVVALTPLTTFGCSGMVQPVWLGLWVIVRYDYLYHSAAQNCTSVLNPPTVQACIRPG